MAFKNQQAVLTAVKGGERDTAYFSQYLTLM